MLMMPQPLPPGRKFFCREWVFSKLLKNLQNLENKLEETTNYHGSNGIIIIGGPGAGKTSLCAEIVSPTATSGKPLTLRKRLLAYHFCQANDSHSLCVTGFILHLFKQFCESELIPGYRETLDEEKISKALEQISEDPDASFREIILLPLLELAKPKQCCFLLVDSIDERSCYGSEAHDSTTKDPRKSKSVVELLAKNTDLLPPWLVPVYTTRTNQAFCKWVNRGASHTSSFKKICLDDLRKVQVLRDVQQYILLRLDQDPSLKQYITKETAEMLNQLHIKSNGCFLYLEKVLDGISENFIVLREVREIPGTLNGLYLWMCQRLFTKKQFSKVKFILNVLLASKKPLREDELLLALEIGDTGITREDFKRRMHVLRRVIVKSEEGHVILFHHSFAEWLIDVKYCTHKYLCHVSDGQLVLSVLFAHLAPHLSEGRTAELSYHVQNINNPGVSGDLLTAFLLTSGISPHSAHRDVCHGQTKFTAVDAMMPEEIRPSKSHSDNEMRSTKLEACPFEGGGEALCDSAEESYILATLNSEDGTTEEGSSSRNDFLSQSNCNMLLHTAANEGNIEMLTYLLARGVEVDWMDADGRTALRAAAWGGHEDIVSSLLSAGASPMLADIQGRTPLIAAAYMGHADIVEKLLDAGADVNHADSDGRTALSVASLCVAASHGHLKVVSLLLERNANVNHSDRDLATPLLVAAFEGNREVCELLLEYEADIDSCDKNARNPLWAAVSMGWQNLTELLLFWGAYVDHIDGDGRTVLSVACAQGNIGVVKLLLARGLDEGHRDNAGWTPIHYAAFEGHTSVCEALVDAGAHINDIDNDGKHALLLAAQEGHYSVVKSLINMGADIHYIAHDGRSALRAALMTDSPMSDPRIQQDIAKLLISRGANVNYCDVDGRSTLYLLALEDRVNTAQFLISCGADIESRDFDGRTSLHCASWNGNLKMVGLLLSAGASIDSADNTNSTSLHCASWNGHGDIVRLLCAKGAKIDHMCNQGATPLCIAAQMGHYAVVKILLENGANPRHSDRFRRTPIGVALKSGHVSISRLLEEYLQAGDSDGNTSGHSKNRDLNAPGNNSSLLSAVTTADFERRMSLIGNSNLQRRSDLLAKQKISLTFTEQVQQLSKARGRPFGGFMSSAETHKSPIYSSPPKSPSCESSSVQPGQQAASAFLPDGRKLCRPETAISDLLKQSTGNNEISSSNQDHESFPFTRDSHMKIILGSNDTSSNQANKSKRNAMMNSAPNAGISGATSALRNGLHALKAGVLEAAAGKRFTGNDSPLVSASSMAVPNVVVQKGKDSGLKSLAPVSQPKKETQL